MGVKILMLEVSINAQKKTQKLVWCVLGLLPCVSVDFKSLNIYVFLLI